MVDVRNLTVVPASGFIQGQEQQQQQEVPYGIDKQYYYSPEGELLSRPATFTVEDGKEVQWDELDPESQSRLIMRHEQYLANTGQGGRNYESGMGSAFGRGIQTTLGQGAEALGTWTDSEGLKDYAAGVREDQRETPFMGSNTLAGKVGEAVVGSPIETGGWVLGAMGGPVGLGIMGAVSGGLGYGEHIGYQRDQGITDENLDDTAAAIYSGKKAVIDAGSAFIGGKLGNQLIKLAPGNKGYKVAANYLGTTGADTGASVLAQREYNRSFGLDLDTGLEETALISALAGGTLNTLDIPAQYKRAGYDVAAKQVADKYHTANREAIKNNQPPVYTPEQIMTAVDTEVNAQMAADKSQKERDKLVQGAPTLRGKIGKAITAPITGTANIIAKPKNVDEVQNNFNVFESKLNEVDSRGELTIKDMDSINNDPNLKAAKDAILIKYGVDELGLIPDRAELETIGAVSKERSITGELLSGVSKLADLPTAGLLPSTKKQNYQSLLRGLVSKAKDAGFFKGEEPTITELNYLNQVLNKGKLDSSYYQSEGKGKEDLLGNLLDLKSNSRIRGQIQKILDTAEAFKGSWEAPKDLNKRDYNDLIGAGVAVGTGALGTIIGAPALVGAGALKGIRDWERGVAKKTINSIDSSRVNELLDDMYNTQADKDITDFFIKEEGKTYNQYLEEEFYPAKTAADELLDRIKQGESISMDEKEPVMEWLNSTREKIDGILENDIQMSSRLSNKLIGQSRTLRDMSKKLGSDLEDVQLVDKEFSVIDQEINGFGGLKKRIQNRDTRDKTHSALKAELKNRYLGTETEVDGETGRANDGFISLMSMVIEKDGKAYTRDANGEIVNEIPNSLYTKMKQMDKWFQDAARDLKMSYGNLSLIARGFGQGNTDKSSVRDVNYTTPTQTVKTPEDVVNASTKSDTTIPPTPQEALREAPTSSQGQSTDVEDTGTVKASDTYAGPNKPLPVERPTKPIDEPTTTESTVMPSVGDKFRSGSSPNLLTFVGMEDGNYKFSGINPADEKYEFTVSPDKIGNYTPVSKAKTESQTEPKTKVQVEEDTFSDNQKEAISLIDTALDKFIATNEDLSTRKLNKQNQKERSKNDRIINNLNLVKHILNRWSKGFKKVPQTDIDGNIIKDKKGNPLFMQKPMNSLVGTVKRIEAEFGGIEGIAVGDAVRLFMGDLPPSMKEITGAILKSVPASKKLSIQDKAKINKMYKSDTVEKLLKGEKVGGHKLSAFSNEMSDASMDKYASDAEYLIEAHGMSEEDIEGMTAPEVKKLAKEYRNLEAEGFATELETTRANLSEEDYMSMSDEELEALGIVDEEVEANNFEEFQEMYQSEEAFEADIDLSDVNKTFKDSVKAFQNKDIDLLNERLEDLELIKAKLASKQGGDLDDYLDAEKDIDKKINSIDKMISTLQADNILVSAPEALAKRREGVVVMDALKDETTKAVREDAIKNLKAYVEGVMATANQGKMKGGEREGVKFTTNAQEVSRLWGSVLTKIMDDNITDKEIHSYLEIIGQHDLNKMNTKTDAEGNKVKSKSNQAYLKAVRGLQVYLNRVSNLTDGELPVFLPKDNEALTKLYTGELFLNNVPVFNEVGIYTRKDLDTVVDYMRSLFPKSKSALTEKRSGTTETGGVVGHSVLQRFNKAVKTAIKELDDHGKMSAGTKKVLKTINRDTVSKGKGTERQYLAGTNIVKWLEEYQANRIGDTGIIRKKQGSRVQTKLNREVIKSEGEYRPEAKFSGKKIKVKDKTGETYYAYGPNTKVKDTWEKLGQEADKSPTGKDRRELPERPTFGLKEQSKTKNTDGKNVALPVVGAGKKGALAESMEPKTTKYGTGAVVSRGRTQPADRRQRDLRNVVSDTENKAIANKAYSERKLKDKAIYKKDSEGNIQTDQIATAKQKDKPTVIKAAKPQKDNIYTSPLTLSNSALAKATAKRVEADRKKISEKEATTEKKVKAAESNLGLTNKGVDYLSGKQLDRTAEQKPSELTQGKGSLSFSKKKVPTTFGFGKDYNKKTQGKIKVSTEDTRSNAAQPDRKRQPKEFNEALLSNKNYLFSKVDEPTKNTRKNIRQNANKELQYKEVRSDLYKKLGKIGKSANKLLSILDKKPTIGIQIHNDLIKLNSADKLDKENVVRILRKYVKS